MDARIRGAIIEACTNHKQQNWRKPEYRACIPIGTEYFVKFGASEILEPEAATQAHIYSYAESDPTAPRIANVLFLFEHGSTTYAVMEYIELVGPADPDRKAKALEWLSKVVPAPGHVLGPVGGGRIRHNVFKNGMAPLDFEDVGALERYFGRARQLLSNQGQRLMAPISISNDRVMYSQSDMDDSNFGIDEKGRTVLLDFESIGLVPATLILSTLFRDPTLRPVLASLLDTLELAGQISSLKSLAAIRNSLWMVADPKLALGNDGRPIAAAGEG